MNYLGGLNDVVEKALALTGLYNFDSSDVSVIICDTPLSDFTNVTITRGENTKSEQGVDKSYHTYVNTPTFDTLSISFLPECRDVDFLLELYKYIQENGGYPQITVMMNGRYLGTYNSYFKGLGNEVADEDVPDKVFEFVIVATDDFTQQAGEL